jgi:hypothetical protein
VDKNIFKSEQKKNDDDGLLSVIISVSFKNSLGCRDMLAASKKSLRKDYNWVCLV